VPLYHVTAPKNVPLILRDGFRDNAARKGAGDIATYQFDPGVWLADVPPITAISVDQFMWGSVAKIERWSRVILERMR
jgi:hypothetical protein